MADAIVKGDLGSEGSYSLSFENKKLVFSMGYDGDGVDGHVEVVMDPAVFIDKLADAIPGELDNAVLKLLKAAFL